MFLNGSLLGFSRREMQGRLDEIVDFSEIGEFIDMEVKHYSSGMYTHLAFAVATAVDPDILITDEVLAVGDEAFQRKCMERIYRFREQGKTIIFVSHALEMSAAAVRPGRLARPQPGAGGRPGVEVIDAYLTEVNRQEAEARREGRAAEEDRRGYAQARQPGGRDRQGRAARCRWANLTRVQAHERLTLRIHHSASSTDPAVRSGIGIHHESGFWLSGPNTRFDGFEIPLIMRRWLCRHGDPRAAAAGRALPDQRRAL